MSIKANQEQSTGNYEKKLWQGNALVKVIAVNPTLAELNKLGVGIKTEPNYKNDNFGKVTFWVENATTGKFPISFLINTPKESTTGKYQYIDKYGKTQWVADVKDLTATYEYGGTTYPSMDIASARKAYGGEADLIQFIANWADVQKDRVTKAPAECRLDTMEKIVKSDVSELKSLFSSLPVEREVWVCLGVRDGQYQDFYSRAFARGWAKEPTQITKVLDKETTTKAHFGSTPYSLQEFNGNGATVGNRVAATSDSSLPF